MIAFDLDGVFLTNINFGSVEFPIDLVLRMRSALPQAIFKPTIPFYIITGRPKQDEQDTIFWLAQNNLKPVKLFHECPDLHSANDYKAHVLNTNPEIRCLIESELENVEHLAPRVNCKVIHFEALIKDAIWRL